MNFIQIKKQHLLHNSVRSKFDETEEEFYKTEIVMQISQFKID